MIRADGFETIITANLGTIMTVGGSIIVAAIATMGAVWAKRARPGSTPVPIQDVWEENRLLVTDAKVARSENRRLGRKFDDALLAVEILWRYVERLRVAWGQQDRIPTLPAEDRAVVGRVLEDVTTPPDGVPVA